MNKYCRILFGMFVLLMVSGNSQAGVPISLYTSHAGNIDYVATGATLRTESNNGNACAVTNSASATLPAIPATAQVQAAYLYWTGSFSTRFGSTQTTPDDTVTFQGATITSDRMFTEDFEGTDEEYFCGFKNVTASVAATINGGSSTFTLSGLSVNTANPHCSFATVVSGWALVVVYEDAGEDFRVVNVYDGFEIYYGSAISLTPDNFQIPTNAINGKMTHISWDGDEGNSGSLNGYTEDLSFNSSQLYDGVNPQNNQYNSTINTASPSTGSYGVDIDTYDITSYLNAGDTSATSRYSSGGDMVLLTAEIISVTNTSVSDLEVTKSLNGNLVVGQTADYTITVTNNGPDAATETITVTDELPDGLTYVASSGTGWTVDLTGLPTVVWTHAGPLAVAGSLPPINLTVEVGSTAYPEASNTAVVSSPVFDNVSSNDTSERTSGTAAIGVVKTSSAGGMTAAGDTIQYDITLTNLDSVSHTNVVIDETLPSGVTYIPESTSVTVSNQIVNTFRDEFNATSFGNSDGTANWSTDWLEVNESDGATSGDIQVVIDSTRYVLQIRDNDGGGEGVQREVDLSAYDTAVLSFDYRRRDLDRSTDYVAVSVSADGGSSWTELDRFEGPDNDSNYVAWSGDISAYIASNTRVRFLSSSRLGGADYVYFDNIEIAASISQTAIYTNSAGDPNQLDDGTPPGLVTSQDGFSIPPSGTMTLSYQVQVDDPLDAGITQIETETAVSDDQMASSITASVVDYIPHLASYESDYATGDNIYYRDPSGTGVGNDTIYIGGSGWLPGAAVDVAYYDGNGDLIYTDVTGTVGTSAFLTSSYDNAADDVLYGTWTAVAAINGTSFQADLPSQLSDPSTIGADEFQMYSWSVIAFTDVSGNPINGYDIPGGSDHAYVQIIDPDQNTDPNAVETITVSIQVTGSDSQPVSGTDVETVVLTETGADTGIFESTSGILISYLPGNANDGTLNATGDDYLYVSYTDPHDSSDSSEVFAYVPTLAILSSFKAYEDGGQVIVEWETVSEVGTLGFYLYRKDPATGKFTPLNREILPGLLVHSQGGTYQYIDTTAVAGETYTYKLVEKECRGKSRIHGPFTITVGGEGLDFVERIYARVFGRESLRKLKSKHSRESVGRFFDQAGNEKFRNRPRQISASKKERLKMAKAMRKKYRQFKRRSHGENVKIAIREQGIYFLDASEIAEAMDLGVHRVRRLIKKGKLSLESEGIPVAWMKAQKNAGIYFYGKGIDSPYTDRNIYWLKKGKGMLMEHLNGSIPENPIQASCFTEVIHAEQNQYPQTALFDNAEDDFWLWDFIFVDSSGPAETLKSYQVSLPDVAPVSGDDSVGITVSVKGGSDFPDVASDHHMEVYLNGVMVGEAHWDGTYAETYTFTFSQTLLQTGDNTVGIKGLADTGASYSFFHLDAIDITYKRSFSANIDSLAVAGSEEEEAITVNGFTNADILVFDVTDGYNPACVDLAAIAQHNDGYSITFPSYGSGSNYISISSAALKKPEQLVSVGRPELKDTMNRADYIIITTPDLADGAAALADYRRQNGLSVKVVMLEDIYNQFNYGIASPWAIRDFISYSCHNWTGPPQLVLLAGDGTYDYKDNLGYGDNLIPPVMISTAYGLFASDAPYADVDNDGKPEVAVGRIPAITSESLIRAVHKIERYENSLAGDWRSRILMLADDPDNGGDFTGDSDTVAGLIPAGYDAWKIYLADLSLSEARALMREKIDAGVLLVNYLGHGSFSSLTSEGLLTTGDIAAFENSDRLPIVTAMTCIAGRFSMPGYDSIGEALMMNGVGGAVAVWSSAGASMNAHAVLLNKEFFTEVFQNGELIAGEAVRKAERRFRETVRGEQPPHIYNFLGDPALRIQTQAVH